jgi:histidinol-phosphate aminotransferase
LLDANENAYGPGLALSANGSIAFEGNNANGDLASTEIDLKGLHRYPDPYAIPPTLAHVGPTDQRTD